MESWFGGGILFAVAAGLWLAYLVPNWLHRREYLASERNAVRLQQTIRVLAETAEAPEALRLENAAKARVVATRLTRQQVLAEARAAIDGRVAAARRLRRTRLGVTIVLVVAVALLGWQGWLAATAGGASLALAVVGALVAVGACVMQYRIDRMAKERAARDAAESREATAVRTVEAAREPRAVRSRAAVPSREWTPQPLPQPLGQVRREAMLAAARAEALGQATGAAEENARIAAARERATDVPSPRAATSAPARGAASDRPAHTTAPNPPSEAHPDLVMAGARSVMPGPTARAAAPATSARRAPSRYASMGIVDHDPASATIDLDSAIARRRAS